MSKVIHVIDEGCTCGAAAEAALLAEGEPLVCIGPPPAELGGDERVIRMARPNAWSAALTAGSRPMPQVLAGGPIAHCWSVSAASDLWAAAGYADLTLLVRLAERPDPGRIRQLAELCRMAGARVVCASESEATAMRDALGPAEVRAIGPLTPDTEAGAARRDELRERMGVGADMTVFAALGPMRRGSGHRRAAWAVTVLTVIELPVRLLVQDLGPGAEDVRRFVNRTAFNEFIVWTDPATGPAELLPAADAAVFLQDGPIPPAVLAGAMRAGLPVIAGQHGAPPFLADGENALLVPADSPRDVARAMLRLIEEEGLAGRLGSAARSTAAEVLDPASIRRQWADLYAWIEPAQAGAPGDG